VRNARRIDGTGGRWPGRMSAHQAATRLGIEEDVG
jgi:hypothetical protein